MSTRRPSVFSVISVSAERCGDSQMGSERRERYARWGCDLITHMGHFGIEKVSGPFCLMHRVPVVAPSDLTGSSYAGDGYCWTFTATEVRYAISRGMRYIASEHTDPIFFEHIRDGIAAYSSMLYEGLRKTFGSSRNPLAALARAQCGCRCRSSCSSDNLLAPKKSHVTV